MIKIFNSKSSFLFKLYTVLLILTSICLVISIPVLFGLIIFSNVYHLKFDDEFKDIFKYLFIISIIIDVIDAILIPFLAIFRLKFKKRSKNDIIEINLDEDSFKAISGNDIIICKISEILLCDYHNKTYKNKIEFELKNGERTIFKIKQGIFPLFDDYENILPRIKWSISYSKQHL